MPQSIYPAIVKIDTTRPLDVLDSDSHSTLENILNASERVNTHLEIITGLELELGEGEKD